MDILFLFTGAICLAEGIDLFMGSDFLIFPGASNKDNFDLEKLYYVEKWLFLIDGICSFVIGLNRFPDKIEYVCLGIIAATLILHVYVFKSRKFRRKK